MEQFFSQWGPASSAFWIRALWVIAIILLFVRLGEVGQNVTRRAMERASAPPNAVLVSCRIIQYAIILLGMIVALGVLGVELSALAAVVGLGTVALTLSLQDITRNYFAGFYLLLEHRFQIGDAIEVDKHEGIIEDIELRSTILRSVDGERVIVPNHVMFTSVVTLKKR